MVSPMPRTVGRMKALSSAAGMLSTQVEVDVLQQCSATLLPEARQSLTMMSASTRGAPKSTDERALITSPAWLESALFLVFLDAAIELVGQRVDGAYMLFRWPGRRSYFPRSMRVASPYGRIFRR